MSKKKKILFIILSCVLLVAAAAGFAVHFSFKKDYNLEQKSGLSMGSVVTIKLYGDDTFKKLDSAKNGIDNLDRIISRNYEDSAVSALNKNGTVDNAVCAEIIEKCRKISEMSGGAFDLTIGSLSSLWNFDEDTRIVPMEDDIKKALSTVDYEKVQVSSKSVTVSEGQSVDLGAVGKGAACDAAKAYLEKSGVKGAVVSVGGSIVAFGKRNKAGDKWRIAVRHPRQENAYIGVIKLSEGFVSTSGDYEKYFEKDGTRYHHILDANTGYPADSGLSSVTVVCNSGLLGDALSTACFVLGEEKSKPLLDEYSAAAVFVDKDLNVSVYGDIDFEKAQ